MLRHYKKKRDILLRALQESFGDKVTVSGMNAGLHVLLQLKGMASPNVLAAKAAQAGVYIHTDNLWVASEAQQIASVLLGFGAIAAEDIEPAIRRLQEAWSGL